MAKFAAFVFSPPGYVDILKSDGAQRVVNEVAGTVAANVGSQGLTARSGGARSGTAITAQVFPYTSDRAAAAVTIQHPAGLAMQGKYGVLSKAVAAAGLEMKSTYITKASKRRSASAAQIANWTRGG